MIATTGRASGRGWTPEVESWMKPAICGAAPWVICWTILFRPWDQEIAARIADRGAGRNVGLGQGGGHRLRETRGQLRLDAFGFADQDALAVRHGEQDLLVLPDRAAMGEGLGRRRAGGEER
jgi:hypothetical protein